jgi:membrane protein DedA with SNARE-associated domain
MEEILINFSGTHEFLSYLIVFFSIFVEGAVVTLLAGVLSAKNYIDINIIIATAFVASVAQDMFFWHLGKNILRLKKTRFLVNIEKTENFVRKLDVHNGPYIAVSKFSWGFNRVVLTAAGMMETPLKEVLKYSIPACLAWSIIIAYLGNIFSSQINILDQGIKTAGILIILLVILFVVLENVVRKQIKKRWFNGNKKS